MRRGFATEDRQVGKFSQSRNRAGGVPASPTCGPGGQRGLWLREREWPGVSVTLRAGGRQVARPSALVVSRFAVDWPGVEGCFRGIAQAVFSEVKVAESCCRTVLAWVSARARG